MRCFEIVLAGLLAVAGRLNHFKFVLGLIGNEKQLLDGGGRFRNFLWLLLFALVSHDGFGDFHRDDPRSVLLEDQVVDADGVWPIHIFVSTIILCCTVITVGAVVEDLDVLLGLCRLFEVVALPICLR